MEYAHERLLAFINNSWVTSILTGLISGVVVGEWYKYRDAKKSLSNGYMNCIYM